VAASVLLVLVWANFHAAFAVAPLLLIAALVGLALRIGLRRFKDARGRELPEGAEASASEGNWIRAVVADYRRLLSDGDHAERNVRYEALDRLATVHLLLGDYETQLRFDLQAVELAPQREEPRRRLAYGLLRLGRGREALTAARELARISPNSRANAAFVRASEAQMAAQPAVAGDVVSRQQTDDVKRLLRQLPVVPRFGYQSDLARRLPLLRADAIDRETEAVPVPAPRPHGGSIRLDPAR
jgi:tetratricopeptide (TPR) repeat protein